MDLIKYIIIFWKYNYILNEKTLISFDVSK